MNGEERYLYFDNEGFYKFDEDTDGELYAGMIQTQTVDGFPASNVYFLTQEGGYQQYADGTITITCTGKDK